MQRIGSLLLAIFMSVSVWAQTLDTVTVMTYNLLFYGTNTSFCTTGNNNVSIKNGHLRTIFNNTMPDILGVQEMSSNVGVTIDFLNNVLNFGGVNRWARANFMNTTTSNIVSLLYYDNVRFGMSQQFPVQTALRDIMYYRLFYREIPPDGDTIFLNVAVMHLKAGSTAADVQQRGVEAQHLMDFLSNRNLRENLIIMGDFNTNSSSEPAYVNFTSHPNPYIRLLDPVNRPGTWWNNVAFADIHSQSPRVTSNGCHVGGGLDDRYDQILINEFVRADSARIRYLPGTYRVVGNDGQRFKGNINFPTNQAVPADVAEALFVASDHLPVVLQLRINPGFGLSVAEQHREHMKFSISGLARDELYYRSSTSFPSILHWNISSVNGQRIASGKLELEQGDFGGALNVQQLATGLYIFHIEGQDGFRQAIRFVKQ
jgi:endonuclease/exonuclease/phosphatase family metal-dependent hydrolase